VTPGWVRGDENRGCSTRQELLRDIADGLCGEQRRFTARAGGAVLSPEADTKKGWRCGRSTLAEFWHTFYLHYTGLQPRKRQLCLDKSLDSLHWSGKGVILPAYKGKWNKGWTKSAPSSPEKIDGTYWCTGLGPPRTERPNGTVVFHRFDSLDGNATTRRCWPRRPEKFDARVVEPVLHRSSHRAPSSGSTTERRQKLVYRPASRSLNARSPQTHPRDDQPIFAPDKRMGEGWAKT